MSTILKPTSAPETYNDYGVDVSGIESIPSEVEQTIRVIDLMKQLDLEFLRPVINELYSEEYRFKFDPIPVLKTIIYWRLKGHRFLSEVHNDLLTGAPLFGPAGLVLTGRSQGSAYPRSVPCLFCIGIREATNDFECRNGIDRL